MYTKTLQEYNLNPRIRGNNRGNNKSQNKQRQTSKPTQLSISDEQVCMNLTFAKEIKFYIIAAYRESVA